MVQADLAWQDPDDEPAPAGRAFPRAVGHTDLIVLPEMFSTGFSMDAERLAEDMDGPTVGWLREEAAAVGCAITGSLIIRDGVAALQPPAVGDARRRLAHYDKRHLFRMAARAGALRARATAARRRAEGMARLPARLLRPAIPGLESQPRRLRPAALRRQLAVAPPHRLAGTVARAGDREPLLCGRRQSHRQGRQRRRLLRATVSRSISSARRSAATAAVISPRPSCSPGRRWRTFRRDFPAHLDADAFELKSQPA